MMFVRSALLGALLLAACSSSGITADSGPADQRVDDGVSTDTVDQEAAAWEKIARDFAEQSFCPKYKECLPAWFAVTYRDIKTCVGMYPDQVKMRRGAPGDPITSTGLKKCFNELGSLLSDCEGLVRFLFKKHKRSPSCQPGTLKDGDPCAYDLQCSSGRCGLLLPDDECGTCVSLARQGGGCGQAAQCDEDLVCVGQVCTNPVALGGACSTHSQCHPFLCLAGTCQVHRQVGEVCTTTYECRPGDSCHASTMVCEAPTFVGAGQSCGVTQTGGWTTCNGDLFCPTNGVCERCPVAGEACEANAPVSPQCVFPTVCIAGTCQMPRPADCTSAWTSTSGKPQTITSDPRNWWPTGSNAAGYELAPDFTTLYKSKPTGHLKSKTPNTPSFGALGTSIIAATYRGKRVRMAGWIRAKDVTGTGGLWMRVDDHTGKIIGFDNMQNRPIKGTSDFVRYEIVLDIKPSAWVIVYGALLAGDGELWIGETTFEVVDSSVPTTG